MSSPTSLRVPCPRCQHPDMHPRSNPMTGQTYDECPNPACGHVVPVVRRHATPQDAADLRRCVEANRLSGMIRTQARKRAAAAAQKHGTRTRYGAGCRCEACVEAFRTYHREAKRKQRQEAA